MVSDDTLGRWFAPRAVALWGDLIRACLWGAVALTWIIFGQIYARLWRLTLTDPAHSDFTIFYFSARLVADGLPMYGASPARYGIEWEAGHLGNLNPPHIQLLFDPLAFLDYPDAYILWTAGNLAALVGAIGVIVRTLRITVTWRMVLIAGAPLIAAAPFTVVAVTSELTFLLLLPATLAWAAARESRWHAAGAWLGVCIAAKLFFLLFVPWLVLRRRWAAVATAAFSGAGFLCVGMVMAGPTAYQAWVATLGSVGWWWLPMNASWHGLVSRILQGGQSVAPVLAAPDLVQPLGTSIGVIIAILSIVGAVALCRKGMRDAAWLLLTLGAVLASPLGWVYYVPLALPPLVGVVATGQWRELTGAWRTAAIGAGLLLFIPLEQAAAGQPSALATVTLASTYFWGTSIPWLALLATSRQTAS